MEGRTAYRMTALGRGIGQRLGGVRRVWLLNAAMVTGGLALFLRTADDLHGLDAPFHLSWWALAVLFFLAESNPVVIHYREDAQEFSLTELPIVLGLFFSIPEELVLGYLLGSTVALVRRGGQSPLQLAFNTSHFFLGVVIATQVFFRVVISDPLGPEGWSGALLATVVVTLIGHAAITAAVVLSGGKPDSDRLPQVLSLGITGTITSTTLGLITTVMLWRDARTGLLLVVPAGVLFIAYKAYRDERSKHASIESIYESTRLLHRAPEVDSAVIGLLNSARQMFRAERAEITLFPIEEGERALRTSLGPDDEMESMARVSLELDEWAWALEVPDDEPFLYPAAYGVVLPLAGRGIGEAMVKVVRDDTRVIGTIIVANRIGEVSHFDAADIELFESLAGNISLVLENGSLEQSIVELRRLEAELRHNAFHDPLTGLANRSSFIDHVQTAVSSSPDAAARMFVLYVDLDDFKTVNDSMGLAAGDELLVSVARRIEGTLADGDLAARLSGDEFALLVERDDLEDAMLVATAVIEVIGKPLDVHGKEIQIRPSIGVAAGTSGEWADELLRNADVAMHSAKTRGKGRAEVFEAGMHVAVIERHELMADLQRAVDRDQFVLHYQPIVNLETGRIAAFEALVRWSHPVRGLVYPDEFIPMAEETGLILLIGRIVLKKACAQARVWQESIPGHEDLAMSINLSSRQMQQPGFVGEIMQVIAESGVRPGTIILEITESVLMEDTESSVTKLMQLKNLGVRLAMDDFGTGYSSLGFLARLPLDILKVAKPFVESIGTGRKDSSFAHAIVSLGQSIDLTLIAEGIERLDQMEQLRGLSCDMGQGYFFGRPTNEEEADELLRNGAPTDPMRGRVIPFPA